MEFLAHGFDGPGPGPWVLLFPLMWAALVAGAVLAARRLARRGGAESPVRLLGRRFAAGEIEAEEYRARLAVLTARRPRNAPGGATPA
ncbi:SHOCT domain-containing protein [Streptomyces sp. DSM 44917]|uniref:SHOCT domain-containing protein n=1 Tax=Streptomyces boetiae TaxID=3075541 RepID=A0ABU2LDS1_9ACTN|nr:SHOCT domain-containing protein [Streptomyces sp. DSM 44917]MDT0309418.1 SHOCT domain-containing protein [Streptomyces sp. DSM 44917]